MKTNRENLQRIARITYMEELYEEIYRAVTDSAHPRDELIALKDKIQELEKYYEGPMWREDYRAEQNGEIPKNLKRGILSEDAIYDLLCDIDEYEIE